MIKRLSFAVATLLCFSVLTGAQEKKQKAYLVSNAHLDTQWNWDVQTTIGEYIPKTFEKNFTYFKRYPWYTFNFEGAVIYSWMKEYYPSDYEMVKHYIKEGRWHVTGASWDANDPNMPSPESFSRNILYGQKFYEQEFGLRSTDIFLPDCFGFGWTLPSVAAHFGLLGFSTQKLEWRMKPFYGDSKIPFEIGLWQGIDGNRIMIAADGKSYSQKWPATHDLTRDESIIDLAAKSGIGTAYRYFGTGDTGGAGTFETMEAIDRSLRSDGPLELISATSDQLYKDYLPFSAHPELPVWDGELLMDVHATGCYSSQAMMKLFNRRNEQMADAAERSAVAADWLGRKYPAESLETSWKRFIWHQFHDDLTGTSIPRAYEFSWNDEYISLKQFSQVLVESVDAVAAELDTRVKGTPVVIYNPSGFARAELVTVDMTGVKVYDQAGRAVPCQKLDGKTVFKAVVPACGYVVYDVRKATPSSGSSVKASGKTLENSVYKLTLDANGDIASIFDKRLAKELVAEGKAIRLAVFPKNLSEKWPAWEIIRENMEVEPEAVTENVKITASGNGALKASLKVERTYGDSKFVQTISLENGSDRIDIDTEVDWATSGALVKAEFPLTCANPVARYDLGLGSVERDNNTDTKYEVYAHQWADLTAVDGSYGVAVLDDCKYGWDKPCDNTIRLTLLHTPETKTRYQYQNRQDFGHHTIKYAIVAHKGNFTDGGVVAKAEAVNQPLKAFVATKHAGSLGKSFSFVSSDTPSIAIRAIKKAEDGDGYIVRLYETAGAGQKSGKLTFAGAVSAAYDCDGNEDNIAPIAVSGNTVPVQIGQFGIKTIRVKMAPRNSAKAVESAPVALPYALKSASFNGFRRDVNFDGKGNALAGELIPETIDYAGITFQLENPGLQNSLPCRGQVIELPEGNWNKLYLLACSTSGDLKSSVLAGDKSCEINVPYYSGFVAQWGHTGHTEGYAKDADIVWVGTHTHSAQTNADRPYEFSYLFGIPVEIPAGTKTITLPKNPRISIFAATVANEPQPAVKPAADLLCIPIEKAQYSDAIVDTNLLTGKPVVAKSGQARASEAAERAFDDDLATKWCDTTPGEKFIAIDLGETKTIESWAVLHAGYENPRYVTKTFSFQVSDDCKEWKMADGVWGNTDYMTQRTLKEPMKARYVRLNITDGEQNGNSACRIYEFAVYGK